MSTYIKVKRDELYHYGIPRKSGRYPWGSGDRPYQGDDIQPKKREKTSSQNKKEPMSPERKKQIAKGIAIIAASTAIMGLSIYALTHEDQMKHLVNKGRRKLYDLEIDISTMFSPKIEKKQPTASPKERGLDGIDMDIVDYVNSDQRYTLEGSYNCTHCSLAYALNSHFSQKVKALPNSEDGTIVDEKSGMVIPGREIGIYDAIFDGIKHYDFTVEKRGPKEELGIEGEKGSAIGLYAETSIKDAFEKIPNDTWGLITIPGHIFNWQKNDIGKVGLIDTQTNSVYSLDEYTGAKYMVCTTIMDLSQATLREGAEDIINLMVKDYKR